MLSRLLTALMFVGFLLSASQTQAGTLSSATWTGDIQGNPFVLTIGGGLAGTGTATGDDANVNLTVAFATAIPVPAPPVALTLYYSLGSVPTATPAYNGMQSLAISHNGTSMNAIAVDQPVTGNLAVYLPAIFNTLFNVPLVVGGPLTTNIQAFLFGITHVTVDVTGFGWKIDPFTVTGLKNITVGGATTPFPDEVFSGTNMLVGGVGTVTLVSPSRIHLCVGGGTTTNGSCTGAVQGNTIESGLTTLKLTFVPEPGTLLLLGAGLAGLVLVGRRSSRSR